jgi:hypothetical protein
MHAIPLPTRRAELVRLHARLLAQAEAEMLAQSFGAADLAPLKQGAQEALAAAQVRAGSGTGRGERGERGCVRVVLG